MSEHSFTPFGYLQNPFYQCNTSYWDVQSGVLRSDPEFAGFGWVLPFPKRAQWCVSVGFGIRLHDLYLITRDDLAPFHLDAVTHTPFLFTYRLRIGSDSVFCEFHLAKKDRLGCRLWRDRLSADAEQGLNLRPSDLEPFIVVRAWRPDGAVDVALADDSLEVSREPHEKTATPPARVVLEPTWTRSAGDPGLAGISGTEVARSTESLSPPPFGEPSAGHWIRSSTAPGLARALADTAPAAAGAYAAPTVVGESNEWWFAALQEDLSRVPGGARVGLELVSAPHPVATPVPEGLGLDGARLQAAVFSTSVPRLEGDFPQFAKNGFHYDLETTRLCTLPASGIFSGHWPTWMVSMPRVVLAEGSMDMARLAYADPELAAEALLTMLRDTPMENTPCVFASGDYNMVAADGSRCGTSPAWCIPFFNIADIYRRTLDDAWVEAIYPHLASLIEFWLRERTDSEGWLTYKCTWEAGEDNNPRIDPQATGDNVISEFVRPVELQAAMAHGAALMAEFAELRGDTKAVEGYRRLHADFQRRTRALWDDHEGRFRDMDRASGAFVAVTGQEDYWGADFTRQSPLSLIALLGDAADEAQKKRMRDEIRAFFRSPFTIWPSWSTFVLEAASACGMFDLAGEMAWEMAARVYATTDRRSLGALGGRAERPTPGAAPEYWPYDPVTFGGNDAYAWGAQSAAFMIRHILGIRASGRREGLGLYLRPSIPATLIAASERPTRRFGVANLAHRRLRLTVAYDFIDSAPRCEIGFDVPRPLSVYVGDRVVFQAGPRTRHRFDMPMDGRGPKEVLVL